MANNLRELYQKHEDSKPAEEDELAINNSGFSFFLGQVDSLPVF